MRTHDDPSAVRDSTGFRIWTSNSHRSSVTFVSAANTTSTNLVIVPLNNHSTAKISTNAAIRAKHALLTFNLFEDVGDVILEIGIFCYEHRLPVFLDGVKVTRWIYAAVVQDTTTRHSRLAAAR